MTSTSSYVQSESYQVDQFDDADEDDTAFVELMKRRLDGATTSTDKSMTENEQYEAFVEEDDGYDDEDEDFYDDFDEDLASGGAHSSSRSNMATSLAAASHNTSKMNLSHSVSNSVEKMQQLELYKGKSHTGRDDRATSEQCLDPRTRLLLFRLLSTGFLELIDGCLSTGKEANVYYAKAGSNKTASGPAIVFEASHVTEYAIKIYKTSILVFKDRDKYVSGEHRWRKGYCKYMYD